MGLTFVLRRRVAEIAYKIRRYPIERRENAAAVRNLAIDLAAGNEFRTGYTDHYTDDRELKVWENYERAFASGEPSEPVFRARYVRDRIREFVPKGLTILNFGCSYGWLEGQLAEYRMVGIDRSETAMRRNRQKFKADFIAGDIFDHLATARVDALCHINVGTYFLPRFISKIYGAATAAGAQYIIAFEPSGRSRQTGQYFDYSTEPRETVVFRGPMLLNNYPALMREAGFSVLHSDILRPPHPNRDFRSFCAIAKRVA
jgi:SAM-dependent methyltransferase